MGGSFVSQQFSLNAGELSPSLLGRQDLEKEHSGCSTARNFFANYRGGLSSRAGTAYIGTCLQAYPVPPRDIPFQFSLNQGYVLEFGETYLRFKANGGYVLDGSNNIYTVTTPYAAVDLPYLKYTQSADVMTLTLVNTSTGVEYPPYDLTRLSNNNWTLVVQTFGANISAPTGLVATVTSSSTPTTWYSYVVTAVDSTTGEESVASTIVSVENNDIALFQGSNTVSWVGVTGADSYNVYAATPAYQSTVAVSSLFGFIGKALGPEFTDTNIIPDFTVVPPKHFNPFARGALTDIVPTAAGVNYSQSTIAYSLSGTGGGSGFTGYPVVANGGLSGFIVTNQGSGYPPGVTIAFTDSGGGVATGNFTFTGNPSNTSNIIFNGGTVITFKNVPVNPADVQIGQTLALTLQMTCNFLNAQSQNLNLAVASYTSDATHIYITYKTPGTVGNAYTLANGTGTTNATASGTNLTGGGTTGTGATATVTVGPQTGTYPGVCAYFQERRVYAASLNNPDTYWMSKPGLFHNMDSSIPTTDGDSITGTPWAQQVNGIQFLQPMPGGLVVLTGKGAWQVNGGQGAAITPSSQTATPQAYNGCNGTVPPIQNNYDILYLQSKGSIFRDLSYNFFVNIYTGQDITVLSNHLFQDFQMTTWAWAEEPYKLIWVTRNDGTLLCLTYLKEQEIYSWTRHDTNGLFVSVCSITEPPVDAVYVIVQRFIGGQWVYCSERMDDRIWENVEDSYCVDSGVQTPLTYPNATLSPNAATGDAVVFNASASVFSGGTVGQVLRVGGGVATVLSVQSGTKLTAQITVPIAVVIPNSAGPLPTPAEAGDWSLATVVSSVSGLDHLDGYLVTGLADGSVIPPVVVFEGSVTLPNPASLVTIGLPYTCQAQTMYLDHPGEGGSTIQNRRKNVSAIGLRVDASRGVQIGADQPDQSVQQNNASLPWTSMTEIKERTNAVFAGNAIPLYTGDYYQAITSGWDLKGQLAIQQVYPLPVNILSTFAYWQAGDDK